MSVHPDPNSGFHFVVLLEVEVLLNSWVQKPEVVEVVLVQVLRGSLLHSILNSLVLLQVQSPRYYRPVMKKVELDEVEVVLLSLLVVHRRCPVVRSPSRSTKPLCL